MAGESSADRTDGVKEREVRQVLFNEPSWARAKIRSAEPSHWTPRRLHACVEIGERRESMAVNSVERRVSSGARAEWGEGAERRAAMGELAESSCPGMPAAQGRAGNEKRRSKGRRRRASERGIRGGGGAAGDRGGGGDAEGMCAMRAASRKAGEFHCAVDRGKGSYGGCGAARAEYYGVSKGGCGNERGMV